MNPEQLQNAVERSAVFLRKQMSGGDSAAPVRYGIILGTGSGELADEIEVKSSIPYGEIPEFPVSTAMGHAGELVFGRLAGKPVLVMKGRFHLYEGYDVDLATLPVHTMRALGVEFLFVSNASGGINPKFTSGGIMLIDSHIDLLYRSTLNMCSPTACNRPLVAADCYDRPMMNRAESLARKQGFPLYRGVYAALSGPNYETRAEYRMLKRIGADVAGMSTVPEVTVAARHGIRALGLSVITNIANPDVLEKTTGEEVIAAAQSAAGNLKAIVVDAIENN